MTPGVRVAAALLLLCAGARGGPDERAQAYAQATGRLGRALVLVAAREGAEAARRLAGERLPARVAGGLERAAGSPAAADLRATGDQLDLQGTLVPSVVSGVPDLLSALDELAALGGARLAQELSLVEAECRRLQGAAATLERAARAGSVPSRLVTRGLEGGEALLLLARGAPLLLDDLARTRAPLPRYELLARVLGRAPDPWAAFLLDLGPRARESAREELLASGDQGEVEALVRQVELRLGGALEALEDAIRRAVEAVTRIRQEELNRTLAGARGPELEEAVRLFQGYKSQFGQPPDLEAQPTWDVYADRRSGRVHFWIEGEGRWERGPERVDPLQPVIDALLQARDPDLRSLASESRALARLFGGFEGSFTQGLTELTTAAEAALAACARVEALAREHGLPAEEAAAALEARAGASLRLLGPAEGQLAALRERLLAAGALGPPGAARDLLRALQATARDLGQLRVQAAALAIEGPGGALGEGVEVDLVWSPDPIARPEAWLLPPPPRTSSARLAVLLVAPAEQGDAPPGPEPAVQGFALRGELVLAGGAPLRPGSGSALRLAPAAGPALVERVDERGGRALRQLPAAGEPLWVWRTGPGQPRPLRPIPFAEEDGWAWALEPAPGEPAGRWTCAGRDASGRERASCEVDVAARPGVVLRAPADLQPLAQGATCLAEVAGQAGDGEREWAVESEAGVPLLRARGARLEQALDLPPGRYRITTPGAAPAWLGVSAAAPRVRVALDPWRAGQVAAVHTGQGVCLRLETWPAVAPDELLQVEWTISGGAREVVAVTRPVPGAPWTAAVLPLRIDPRARPGERRVAARAHTLRGVLAAEGSFQVAPGGGPLTLELRTAQGEEARALVLGSEGLLRAPRELRDATWLLVGPRGTVRLLVPRWDGQVPLPLLEHDPPGPCQVWLTGRGPGGEVLHGQLALLAYPPRGLEVRLPPAPRAGDKVRLEAIAPAGYAAPFRVRLARGAWLAGTALEVAAQPQENACEVELEDAQGRRAAGRVVFKAAVAAAVEGALRWGIAADARERRVFAVDHALLQSYKRSNNLPPAWVVLEPGPLTSAAVRDRLWQTVPFDGPSDPGDAQGAYRSARFWERLQESARARFAALEAREGEAYAVQNSPAATGEPTLRDLAARLLHEQGGWDYRLAGVRFEAEGAAPDPAAPAQPGEPLRFQPAATAGEGEGLGRVLIAGPLGRLWLRPTLPAELPLGRDGRVGITLVGEREPLVAGRSYPGGWERLAPQAALLLEVEATVSLDGQELTTTVRRADPELVAIDLGLLLEALGTERLGTGATAVRVAERTALRFSALHESPQSLERRLLPAPPGALDPAPRELRLRVAARLVPAVPPAAWPAGRPRPDAVFVDAVPWLPDATDLPRARVLLEATWLRASREAPAPAPGPALGDRLAAPRGWPAEEPLDAARLEETWPPEGPARLTAARALRRALLRAPGDARALALLADLALAEGRALEAQNLARWALGAGASPRAQVVELEALLQNFRLEEARRALLALGQARLSPELRRRLEAARDVLPR